MRLAPSEPKNESGFFARLNERSRGTFYYERVEPANESGFPDIYFVRRGGLSEGTIELKFAKTELPNLKALCRGTQKAALLEYYAAGGRRRFALCYCNGDAFLWDTRAYFRALRDESLLTWTSRKPLEAEGFTYWLENHLEQ